jgi:tRNA pseudouridine32 synthase/23S rRNA pseudouridine746 synthase
MSHDDVPPRMPHGAMPPEAMPPEAMPPGAMPPDPGPREPEPPPNSELPPSTFQLPPGAWPTVLDCLCDRFPAIPRERWLDRFARGRVLDARGCALPADAPHRVGSTVRYFREVPDEPAIPFAEDVLHADEHLVVADKPPFLPVAPTGAWVRETLLARLVRRLGNPALAPLHRIDRLTSGLVLFSANPATRDRYQALFRERRIAKEYRALAAPLPDLSFPLERRTRIERGEPFFRMRESAGPANALTRIDVLARDVAGADGADSDGTERWQYVLVPVTGRKHQLRVHLAALGAPIANDPLYPELAAARTDDYARPLTLLAHALEFRDPVTGVAHRFVSRRVL